VVIRAAVAGDVGGVVALERATAEAPHWPEGEYRRLIEPQETRAAVRHVFFVAEVEERLAGFAVGRVVSGVGELESVAVDVRARRRGVGRRLCEAVVEWCRDEGAEAVELEVRDGGEAARRLYVGMGFRETGRRRGYYRNPVDDAVLMKLRLGG
jgi:[ribosomal protein S18]-alanine N-acetyltransferase